MDLNGIRDKVRKTYIDEANFIEFVYIGGEGGMQRGQH